MKTILVAGLVLLPHLLFAGTDCRVKEYSDHYVAECVGDTMTGPAMLRPSAEATGPAPLRPSAAATGSAAQQEVILKDATPAQQPVLSKRNLAKINAAHQKELKRKAMNQAQQDQSPTH